MTKNLPMYEREYASWVRPLAELIHYSRTDGSRTRECRRPLARRRRPTLPRLSEIPRQHVLPYDVPFSWPGYKSELQVIAAPASGLPQVSARCPFGFVSLRYAAER